MTPSVREATFTDASVLAEMLHALWPDRPVAEHREQVDPILAGSPRSTLPLVIFVAQVGKTIVGFLEVGLRSHADGCDGMHPVGFVEGWYVEPAYQRRGIGRLLCTAAEQWARGLGCREMASDASIDDLAAQEAHDALDFAVVDRRVHYRKVL